MLDTEGTHFLTPNLAPKLLKGVPHPDGAICEDLPLAIDEIGHGLVAADGMAGQIAVNGNVLVIVLANGKECAPGFF